MLTVSVGSVQAQSVGNTIKYDGVTYTFTSVTSGNRTVKITSVDNTVTGEVSFPSEILDEEGNHSYMVTDASVSCSSGVTGVVFPEGLKTLSSISGNSVKTIRIPSSVTSITIPGSVSSFAVMSSLEAFVVDAGNPNYCSQDGCLYNKDMTTLLKYPNGKQDTRFSVPEGVKKITSFYCINNSKLQELILPSTMESIARTAISCSITEIDIPASVSSLEHLHLCSRLTAYHVAADNENYCDIDGVLVSKDQKKLIGFPRAKPIDGGCYTVPSFIEVLGQYSFTSKGGLQTLDLSESNVTSIETRAFHNCGALTTIISNDKLEKIGTEAFRDCKNIKTFDFPESLKTVEAGAFNNCDLETVYIPATLTSIGAGVFQSNKNLKAFSVSDENPKYSALDGVLFNKTKETLEMYPPGKEDEHYDIPEGTVTVASSAFNSVQHLQSVNIASTVAQFGVHAFYACSMSTVTFSTPSSLETISAGAFYSCANLSSIEIPATINTIAYTAFYNCQSLEEFKIPDNSQLTSIGVGDVNNTPFGASHLKTFVVGKNTKLTSIGYLYSTYLEKLVIEEGNTALTSLTGLKNLTNLREVNIAPDCGIKAIGKETFWGCTALERLTLPQTVQTLGVNAFYNTPNLKEIVFAEPSQLKTISENAFQKCGIEQFTLPESVVRIDRQAFHGCDVLQEVNLPKNTTSVDPEAFYLCSQLKAINVDKENEVYSSADGYLCNKEKTELMIFPAGKASNNFTLLPPSLTKIGKQAFFGCKNLQKVMIPKKVTAIDESAFWLCDNLKDIVLLGDAPIAAESVGTKAFPTDMASTAKLWVRHSKTADYQAADFWKEFTDIEEAKLTADGAYEFFAMDDTKANLLSIQKDDETLIIPETVEADGNSYTVDLIGDYAFEDCHAAINEVIVNHPVSYVGARAFVNGTRPAQIQNVFFVGTTPATEVATAKFDISQTYAEVNASQHLYVKKSALETYQTAWPQLREQLSYQIPLSMGSEYGTFCREFDTDLSELNASTTHEGWPNVIAFTAGKYAKGTDEEGNPCYYVRMKSINLNAAEGDGTYIPANTAVLLRTMDGAASTSEFFYQIHEDDLEDYSADNLMCGVTVKAREVQPTEDEYTNFLVSGGMLHKMTVPRTFPAHKAYMRIPTVDIEAAGSKVLMLFEETDAEEGMGEDIPASNEPTDTDDETSTNTEEHAAIVDGINAPTQDEAPVIHNINGQLIQNSLQALPKGIYIVNGKKTVIK